MLLLLVELQIALNDVPNKLNCCLAALLLDDGLEELGVVQDAS